MTPTTHQTYLILKLTFHIPQFQFYFMEEPKGGNNFKHIFKTKPKNGKNEKILKVCLVTTFENSF